MMGNPGDRNGWATLPRAGGLRVVLLAISLLLTAAHTAPAQESWQQKLGTFRIGILAEPGGDTSVQHLAALKKAYTLALGVPVEFFVADDYRDLIEAQAEKRVDYAVYSATAYAAAALFCDCVSPLVAPTGTDGAIGMRSVLIARTGGLKAVSDMSKYRIAIGGEEDVARFRLPLFWLRKEGIALSGDEPFLVHAGSAEEAEALLLAGDVDAMFGWIETGIGRMPIPGSGTLDRLARSAPGAFSVIWTSDLLRYGPHALRKDLDPEVRRRLVPFLVGLKDSDPDLFEALARYQLGGFVSVGDADYTTALDMVRMVSGATE